MVVIFDSGQTVGKGRGEIGRNIMVVFAAKIITAGGMNGPVEGGRFQNRFVQKALVGIEMSPGSVKILLLLLLLLLLLILLNFSARSKGTCFVIVSIIAVVYFGLLSWVVGNRFFSGRVVSVVDGTGSPCRFGHRRTTICCTGLSWMIVSVLSIDIDSVGGLVDRIVVTGAVAVVIAVVVVVVVGIVFSVIVHNDIIGYIRRRTAVVAIPTRSGCERRNAMATVVAGTSLLVDVVVVAGINTGPHTHGSPGFSRRERRGRTRASGRIIEIGRINTRFIIIIVIVILLLLLFGVHILNPVTQGQSQRQTLGGGIFAGGSSVSRQFPFRRISMGSS